jgi:hypothetical protein
MAVEGQTGTWAVLGVAMSAVGAGGVLWLVGKWVASQFGPFPHLPSVIFFSLWLDLGVQMTFSSFFLCVPGVSGDTYVEDY